MPITIGRSLDRPWMQIPNGWDATWMAAKAASATTPTWIAVIGDSISSGVKASDYVTLGFTGKLKTALKARGYTWYADFWPVEWSNAVATAGGYTWGGTPPWSYTLGGDMSLSAGGYHKHLVYITASAHAAYDLATFTTPYATTKIVPVYHPGGTASGFSWKVDGGTAINATDAFDGFTKSKDSGTLSNATHTVTFGNATGQFKMTMSGVITYESTTVGIGMARLGGLGAAVNDYLDGTGQPAILTRQMQGLYASGTTGFGFPTQPSLAIIELGANDCNSGTTIANFREGLVRMVSALRRGRANCSIMFVIPSYPDGVSSDVTTTLANPFLWSSYVNVILEVAGLYQCAVVSIHAKWGETGVADGYQTAANDLHPTDTGHSDIATVIGSMI